jgi:hypothetical protein
MDERRRDQIKAAAKTLRSKVAPWLSDANARQIAEVVLDTADEFPDPLAVRGVKIIEAAGAFLNASTKGTDSPEARIARRNLEVAFEDTSSAHDYEVVCDGRVIGSFKGTPTEARRAIGSHLG